MTSPLVSRLGSPIAAAALGCCLAGPALASTFGATELGRDAAILSQFNLVNLGDYTNTAATSAAASIDGRVVIGGKATFGNTAAGICTVGCSSNGNIGTPVNANKDSFSALTVFGSLVTGTGGITTGGAPGTKGGNSANVAVNGAVTGKVNLGNSASFGTVSDGTGTIVDNAIAVRYQGSAGFKGTATNSAAPSAQTTYNIFNYALSGSSLVGDFTNPLTDLSRGIANLPGTPNVKVESLPTNGNSLVAGADYTTACTKNGTAASAACTYGVVKTTITDLAAQPSFGGIQNGSNAATFVIVTGTLAAGASLPTLGAGSYSNVIYDFVDATELRFAGAWNASILAPLATITSEKGTINGSVVVASMAQSQALNAGNAFTGDLSGLTNTVSFRRVPEPASIGLISVGLAAVGWARRRRKASTK